MLKKHPVIYRAWLALGLVLAILLLPSSLLRSAGAQSPTASGEQATARGNLGIGPQHECEPVENVSLRRDPEGDLFVGGIVQFEAEARGSMPFHYAWTVDGLPHEGDQNTFEYQLIDAEPHTVAVTVTNECGHGSDSMVVQAHSSGEGDVLAASNDSPTILGNPTTLTATVTSGAGMSFEWDFGDGTSGAGAVVTHIYPDDETYTAVVTALIMPPGGTTVIMATATTRVTIVEEGHCEPIEEVELEHHPEGDLVVGDAVRFKAEADGSRPFDFAWTVDDTLQEGENHSHFHYTLSDTLPHTVRVRVTNACGEGSASQVVQAEPPAGGGQPNLSHSHKSVNLTAVEVGDTLSYMLVLRNTSEVTAAAILTDAIPAGTTYVSGSLQASGTSVMPTFDGSQVLWSGELDRGTPVVVEFAARVTGTLGIGQVIANQALLNDGLGHVLVLRAASTYNPGYRLTINEGALYTNVPTVTLRYNWSPADDIRVVQFSNDGGFPPGPDTSAWLPVNPITPTYAPWILTTFGNLILPRTVYARFRNTAGIHFGPVSDEIIYDPTPPPTPTAQIVYPSAAQGLRAQGQPGAVLVIVTAGDDNSGVGVIQISEAPGFATYAEYPATGATTTVPYQKAAAGDVYVRVVDRAGNPSAVAISTVVPPYKLYLPLATKSP